MNRRILIMAGGTGGHVFPALAVAEEMRARGWQVSWLGTKAGLEAKVVPTYAIDIDWLVVQGIRGKGLWSKIKATGKLLYACYQAFIILRQRKPAVVLGMGGFVSVPGGLMAKLLAIPLVIHEQNRIPGSANRLLARLAATRVLEAFPGSFNKTEEIICTGNPIRQAFMLLPQKSFWHANEARALRILILGGSQGAKILNESVPTALAQLSNLDIVHQTGSAMQVEVSKHYAHLGLSAKVQAFIEDMAEAYQWADLIICRAGAMTVSEVAVCGLPAIFIPLITAIDDHQTANAHYLTDTGAAVLLPQPKLNSENLLSAIKQVMSSLTSMSLVAKNMARPNATQIVADYCVAEAAL